MVRYIYIYTSMIFQSRWLYRFIFVSAERLCIGYRITYRWNSLDGKQWGRQISDMAIFWNKWWYHESLPRYSTVQRLRP